MPLGSGTRLGPYEILSPLGAGGMGEVWRARDSRLGRHVALKVLPERLSDDRDALARFEDEARAVAALSHPNILGIHDVGRIEGVSFAVTELLEGETLRSALRHGALPPKRALEVAARLGEALAAAHEKGIVHRDVKPGNVFVTREGRVKLLDFGLARFDRAWGGDGDTASPTISCRTNPGTVVGTVSYMSPEQAGGRPVDGRSDLFSLGVVLYEMLAGRRPFTRGTAPETLAAILREEPEPLETAAPAVPASIRWVVSRCLEKEPGQRFQSARDLVFALEAMRDVSSGSSGGPRGAVAGGRRRTRVVAAALSTVAGLGAAFWFGRVSTGPVPPRATATPRLVRITWEPGPERFPSISPDGGSLVYQAGPRGKTDIFLRRIGGENPVNLTKEFPGADTTPAFSPDGRWIAFHSDRDGGGVFLMGATGESPRRLTDLGYEPAWSPDDGKIVFATASSDTSGWTGRSELRIVDVATGAQRTLYERDGRSPSWSPSGSRIAFHQYRGLAVSSRHALSTIPVSGGEPTVVLQLTGNVPSRPDWTRAGILFDSIAGGVPNAWRVRVDEATGAAAVEAEQVVTATSSVSPSSTADGRRILFESSERTVALERFAFDPVRGKLGPAPLSVLSGPRDLRLYRPSPDGEWLATLLLDEGGRRDILLVRTLTGETRRLTDDPLQKDSLAWAPDGSRLYFCVAPEGTNEVWSIRPDGSGRERVVGPHGKEVLSHPIASPDGRALYVEVGEEGRPHTVDLGVPLPRRRPMPLPPLSTGRQLRAVAWSPDGRWLIGGAYSPSASSSGSLHLLDLEKRAYEELGSDGGVCGWLPDSRRILLRGRGGLEILDRVTRTVTPAGSLEADVRRVALSDDGRSLYTMKWTYEGDIWMLDSGTSR